MTIKKSQAPTEGRHLPWEEFAKRIDAGVPFLEVISGSPKVVMYVATGGTQFGIRFSSSDRRPIENSLAEIEIESRLVGREAVIELPTANCRLYQSFYHFCCAAADAVQLQQQTIKEAVETTLASWASLIRRKSLLSSDRQVGLYGELLFLNACAERVGWKAAAQAWLGPYGEEHDFVLEGADVDAKCTTAERRTHWISSLTQLVPKAGRQLALVSIQITPASSRQAKSLPQLVAATLAAATSKTQQAGELIRAALDSAGWADEDIALYPVRYTLRSELVVVPVDDKFPSITPVTLSSLGASRLPRIEELHYRINVDGLGKPLRSSAMQKNLFRGSK